MTLTALTDDGRLLSPSLDMERGASKLMVTRVARQAQDEGGLFCPHCYETTGRKLSVRLRDAEGKRLHFFHDRGNGEEAKCNNYQGISEKHLNAQAAIQDYYTKNFPTCTATLETVVKNDTTIAFRRPDILVTHPNGVMEAHEVQVSPISTEDLLQRSRDLRQHGVGAIAWYLYGKACTAANINACLKAGIAVNKLSFTEDDFPSWNQLTQYVQETKTQGQSSSNGCSQQSGKTANYDKAQYIRNKQAKNEDIVKNPRHVADIYTMTPWIPQPQVDDVCAIAERPYGDWIDLEAKHIDTSEDKWAKQNLLRDAYDWPFRSLMRCVAISEDGLMATVSVSGTRKRLPLMCLWEMNKCVDI